MFWSAMRTVFRRKAYVSLAAGSAALVFTFGVWLPNLRLLASVITDQSAPVSVKLALPVQFLWSIDTNFTALSATYLIAISVLFGIDVALIVYSLRRGLAAAGGSAAMSGFFGVISGALGTGCAACGMFLLWSGLSLGASGIILSLPFRGGELGIIGVLALSLSIRAAARLAANPPACEISPAGAVINRPL